MIQSSTRNSILEIYGLIQLILAQAADPIYRNTGNEASQFVTAKGRKEQFPGKRPTIVLRSLNLVILVSMVRITT